MTVAKSSHYVILELNSETDTGFSTLFISLDRAVYQIKTAPRHMGRFFFHRNKKGSKATHRIRTDGLLITSYQVIVTTILLESSVSTKLSRK
ncbi:MAG: hypothetical protein KDJ65_32550 [Anaerolineae bacterium]|nr:hypothetical protein [Anaerolineae bacterium]